MRAVDEGECGAVGDEELALGMGEVAHELVTAVRGVGPHDDRTGQGGALEPEDEFGDVVQEDSHVKWSVRAPGLQPGGAGGGARGHLGMGQAEASGDEPGARVGGPGEHGTGDGFGGLGPLFLS